MDNKSASWVRVRDPCSPCKMRPRLFEKVVSSKSQGERRADGRICKLVGCTWYIRKYGTNHCTSTEIFLCRNVPIMVPCFVEIACDVDRVDWSTRYQVHSTAKIVIPASCVNFARTKDLAIFIPD